MGQAPDPAVLADIRQSAGWLTRHDETFARQLYGEMTQLVPGSALPPAFAMEAFCRRMVRTLLWAALTDQPGHVVIDVVRETGGQNWRAGFPDEEYANVAHALVQAVRDLTSDDWSTSTGSAWVSFFLWAWPYLTDGAWRESARDVSTERAGSPPGEADAGDGQIMALDDPRSR